MAKKERNIQNEILLKMSKEFAPNGLFWTADVLTGVPMSSIKTLPYRIKAAYKTGGIEGVVAVIKRLPILTAGIEGGCDIQGSLYGRWVGIEVKSEKGTQQKSQKIFQRNIEKPLNSCV